MQRAVLAFALVLPAAASAQISDADKATARALAQQGQDALDKRDYSTAADRFARAGELVRAPTLALGLARAQVGLGKWVSASETYQRILREEVPTGASPAFARAVAEARTELTALEPRIPSVTIVLQGAPSARVTVDGVVVPSAALGIARPVDPGNHAVRGEADGFATVQTSFIATERKSATVTLTLMHTSTPEPSRPPAIGPATPPLARAPSLPLQPETPPAATASGTSVRKTIGIVGLGVGGAGLVLGAITGGISISKHAALAKVCSDGRCPDGQASALGDYHVVTSLSTAGFVAGGILTAAGMVLVITAPKATAGNSAGIAPLIGAGQLGATGWF